MRSNSHARERGLRAPVSFGRFSLMAAPTRGVGFTTDDEDMKVTLVDMCLRFCSDGSGRSKYSGRIDPDDDYIRSPLSVPEPIENPELSTILVPLGFHATAPGSDDSQEIEWLNTLIFVSENLVHHIHPLPLALPFIVPGSADSR